MGYDHLYLNRSTPGCLVFLLNQSGSMRNPMTMQSTEAKSHQIAASINALLMNLIVRCTGHDGVQPFVDVGVIGYRTDRQGSPIVETRLRIPGHGSWLASIVQVEENILRIETQQQQVYDADTDEVVEMPTKVPIWIDPVAEGAAPLCAAVEKLHPLLDQWCRTHPRSFPPVVIHFTDRESDDGDPGESIEVLKSLRTTEETPLLWINIYLCSKPCDPQLYVANPALLPDPTAKQLWQMASVMPPELARIGRYEGLPTPDGSRMMMVNADFAHFLQLLEWGSGSVAR